MPNWTWSTISMKGIGKKRLYTNNEFDFNKIVSEPKTMDECLKKYGKKYIDEGNCHLAHSEEDKWFNWYDWHCDFWGTKWNASDTAKYDDDTIQITTAWTEPEPVFRALSKKYPKEKIHIYAEYEDGFETESIYLNGKRIFFEETETDGYDEEEFDEVEIPFH